MNNVHHTGQAALKLFSLPLGTKLLQAPFAISASHKKYASIIFDLGGVLIDWRPEQLMMDLFPDTDAPTILQTLTKDPLWLEFDRGTVNASDIAEYGNAVYGFDKNFTEQIISTIPHNLQVIPGMVELFKRCKEQGFKIYILSNIPELFFQVLTKKYDFFKSCDGIIASYIIKQIKPELGIYSHLLQQFNINPETALFIDDLEANIRAGNALGIDGIVCKNSGEVSTLMTSLKLVQQQPHSSAEASILKQQMPSGPVQ